MASDDGAKFYLRFVTQKHSDLTKSITGLVNALVSENLEVKKEKTKLSLKKAQDLKSAIADEDLPDWLTPLIEVLTKFFNGSNTQQALIGFIIRYEASIKSHVWVIEKDSEQAFNFDSIFEHYKSESRIPELFDEIIKILEDIEASGEIDSISMLSALTKVIATLKKNKDGSFFSMNSAWSFVTSFFKYYFLAEISKVPVLGSALLALQKVVDETNQEMSDIKSNVELKIKETVEQEIKPLRQRTELPFLAYDGKATEVTKIPLNSFDQQT